LQQQTQKSCCNGRSGAVFINQHSRRFQMQTTVNTSVTSATNAAEIAQAMPAKSPEQASVKLDAIKAKVKVSTHMPADRAVNKLIVKGTQPKLSVERATEEDENLVKHERSFYVQEFKRGVEKTARATLETCRVVYEASRVLDNYQFQNFCTEVGYRDGSSSIRKFIAIGKVYPRFIQYADQLPSAWTAIYQITQIPADEFDAYIKHGKRLDQLKGKRLAEMTRKTMETADITKPLPYDDKAGGHVFAKLVSAKKLDDKDWRAVEKAMNEMQARLPVRFIVSTALKDLITEARLRSYENSKKHFVGESFRPDTWDMGEEANAVLPRDERVIEVA